MKAKARSFNKFYSESVLTYILVVLAYLYGICDWMKGKRI